MKKIKSRTKSSIKTKIQTKIALFIGATGIALAAAAASLNMSDRPLATSAGDIPPSSDFRIYLDPESPQSGLLLGGSDNNSVLDVRLANESLNDQYTLQKISFVEQASTFMGQSPGYYRNRIDSVKLTLSANSGPSQTIEGAVDENGKVVFSDLNWKIQRLSYARAKISIELNESMVSVDDRVGWSVSSDVGDFSLLSDKTGLSYNRATKSPVDGPIYAIRETTPNLRLSPLSPSGSAVPGVNNALTFDIAPTGSDDLYVQQLAFRVMTSDNANSGWNKCAINGSTTGISVQDFTLVDSRNSPVDTDASWRLLNTQFGDCRPGDRVGYAVFTTDQFSELIIPTGERYSFRLQFDSMGASSAQDDVLQVTLNGSGGATSGKEISDVIVSKALRKTDTVINVNPALSGSIKVGDVIILDTVAANGGAVPSGVGVERMLVTSVSADRSQISVIRSINFVKPYQYAFRPTGDMYVLPSTIAWKGDEASDLAAFWGWTSGSNVINGGSLVF